MKFYFTLLLAGIVITCHAQKKDSGPPISGGAFLGIAPEGGISSRSLTGSYVAFDPSEGGATCYTPFAMQDFVFRAESFSPDWESVTSLWLRFPNGWLVNHASLVGAPWCNDGSWGDFSYTIEGPNVIKINHSRYQGDGAHCIAYYMINVMAGNYAGDAGVSWYWLAEGWGAPPYWPCSSNGYTPPGQPPCDEQIHPPATIPVCGMEPSISITPFVQIADACPGEKVNFNLSLLNETGAPQTFMLNYTVLTGNGIASGPYLLTVDQDESKEFTVSLNADFGLIPQDVVNAIMQASGGGFNAMAHISLNVKSDGWENIASEPNSGRMDNVLVSYDNLIWSIVGHGSNHTVRTYNPASNSWTVIPDSEFPHGQNYARSGASYGSKVYVYGDAVTVGFTGLWSYDMENNVWANETPSGTPPAQTGIWAPAWVADPETGYLYITGGATSPGGGNLTTVYVYNPATNSWLTPLPNFTSSRNFHAAYILTNPVNGHKMLAVAGGINSSSVALSSTQCYDFVTGTWNAENFDIPALPHGWWGMGYAHNINWGKHELWLVAGLDASLNFTPGSAYYDVANGIWVDAGSYHATKVFRTSAIAMNGVVYKIGGSTGSFNHTGLSSKFSNCPEEPHFLPFAEDFTGIATGQIPDDWSRTTSYWSVQPGSYAGGVTPEVMFLFNSGPIGSYRLISPFLYGTSAAGYKLSFKHSLNHFLGPYKLKVQTSKDGIEWNDEWVIVDPTDIPPETITLDFSNLTGEIFQIAWVFDGDPLNINFWNIDDINVKEKIPGLAPDNLTATLNKANGEVELNWDFGGGFYEDFSDGIADNWVPRTGNWSVTGNSYHTTNSPTYLVSTSYYDRDFSDFEYEVKLRKTTGSGCGAGIIFNGVPTETDPEGNWTNHYQLYYCFHNGAWYLACQTAEYSWHYIQFWTISPDLNLGVNEWNILKVVFSAGYFDVYFNGILQGSYFDDTFLAGKVGLKMYDSGLSGGAEFDYASLTPIPDGYAFGMVNQEEMISFNSGLGGQCVDEVDKLSIMEQRNAPIPAYGLQYTYHVPEGRSFQQFIVYRDGAFIGNTTLTTFHDQLPGFGVYEYTITALYNEGESLPAGPAEVSWLEVPVIEVAPSALAVELLTGHSTTIYLTLSNTGIADLYWSASVVPQMGLLAEKRQEINLEINKTNSPENSNQPPKNPVQAEVLPDNTRSGLNNVLIFRNQLPWGLNVNETLLQNLGATVSFAFSAEMSTIDLSPYGLIIFESAQTADFYMDYVDNFSKFENYVSAGGVIQFHCATFDGERIPNLTFPGGMKTRPYEVQDLYNYINNPNHPIVSGLNDPLYGNYASHEAFINLPAGTDVIVVNGSDMPTTVEYSIGLGRMIVTGMAWEYSYSFGYSSGDLLPMALEYSYGMAFPPYWLTVSPENGTLLPGTSTPVQVNINTEYLAVGTYLAHIVFQSNDPVTPNLIVTVELEVVEEYVVPDFTYVTGVEYDPGSCHNALISIVVNDYTVEPSAGVEMISAGNILFYPDVHIKEGAYLWAHISEVFCIQEKALVADEGITHEEPVHFTATRENLLFRVYPNPTTGIFTLQLMESSLTSTVVVEIYGIMGERVFQTQVAGHERFDIDLSFMPRGIYLVKVIAGAETGVSRILKQ